MTLYTRRAIMVVIENRRLDANNIAKLIDIAGGERTFHTAALSPTGDVPPTHYWCHWVCTEAEWTDMETRFATMRGQNRLWLYDGLTTTPEQVLAIHGVVPCRSPLT